MGMDLSISCMEISTHGTYTVARYPGNGTTLKLLYSCSPSFGSDVSTQTHLLSACTHSLLLRACEISLGACDLALRLANKRTTSLPEDGEPEYRWEWACIFPEFPHMEPIQ